ncbi:MAG: PAS domain S-box protein, partial [Methanoregula sp.]|nr:PAS domain S-box protein [Methanoregula sp.]
RDDTEKQLARSRKISPTLKDQTPEELIHELRVHQIEPETQAEELRKAHLALEESRDKYLDLYEFAPIGYLTLTDKALIADVNLTGATLLGVERSRLKRARFRKYVAPPNLDEWDRYFVSVREQGEKQTCTLTLRRGDGSVFPARLESIRLTGSSDGTTMVRVAISDMTEISRAEDALRETNEYLNKLIDFANAPIIVWDPGFRITRFNHAFEHLTGRDEQEVIGQPLDILFPKKSRNTLRALIKKTLAGERWETVEIPILASDGTIRTVLWNSANLLTSGAELISTIAQGVDITERKQAEELNALTTRKLALMNDVTYQFIQNKVTAVRGYAELSKDAKTEAELLSFIEKEEHILADIHQLIKNTREYQEIGLLQPQWIPVEQSIRIAFSLVSPKQGISIEIALHGLELYSDPFIEKIFSNLIENAVIHGKTLTRIQLSCEEKPDRLILICEDDGVGISHEIKAHLFKRSVGEKIHFGLFFVRECLAFYGMSVTETGEFGKGARFEITVPKEAYRFTGTDIPAGGNK